MLVQIHLRAVKLDNISQSSWRRKKSNPYAKICLIAEAGVVEVGCTEVCHNTLSPTWSTILTVDYDEVQKWTPLRITIYDSRDCLHNENRMAVNADSIDRARVVEGAVCSARDGKMGEVDLEVGEILGMEGQERECALNEGGCIFVHITPSIQNTTQKSAATSRTSPITGLFTAQIRGLDLKNIESGLFGLGAIDPYFEVSKRYHGSGATRWHLVYRSEHIHNIINPYWDAFQLDLDKLCHGDLKRELKIAVFDYEKKSSDRYLGEVEVTVEELMESVTKGGNACREFALRVFDTKGDVVGLLLVLKAKITRIIEDDGAISVVEGKQEGIEHQLAE